MDDLKKLIREVPDYPKPGILFYDLTTLLKDKAGFHALIDRLCDHYKARTIDVVAGIDRRGDIFAPAPTLLFWMEWAEGFEKAHTCRDGDVERFHGTGGGQRDDKVAAFARQVVETFAFAAKHDAYRRRVVSFGVTFVGAFIEADEPIACFFQLFHRLREICDFGDRQMRERASGGACDRVGEASGTAFRNDHAVRAIGEGRSNDRAEIVRIFGPVE